MASLKTLVQTEVQDNFLLFEDIRTPVVYTSVASADYDTSVGAVEEVVNSTQSNVYMIFTSYRLKDVDGQMVHINDQKAICPALDLNVVPTDLDYFVADSVRWDVKNVTTDPANAAWVLQVRKKVVA